MGNLIPYSKYGHNLSETHWLIDNMLTFGGTSLLAGDPKAGKSQFVRHLIQSLMHKSNFLGNEVSEVKTIIYLALEETPIELKKYLRDLNIAESDNLLIGDRQWSTGQNNIKELENDIVIYKPAFCVIDTYVAFSDLQDMNDYAKVYKALQLLAQMARKYNCHIMIVHHKNKSENTGTKGIMGSQAFFGAVDTALLLSGESEQKSLSIEPRYTSRREVKFNMNPSKISNISEAFKGLTCKEALLLKIQSSIDGLEYRSFTGYSKQTIQNAKIELINEGKVFELGGKSGEPLKLFVKN